MARSIRWRCALLIRLLAIFNLTSVPGNSSLLTRVSRMAGMSCVYVSRRERRLWWLSRLHGGVWCMSAQLVVMSTLLGRGTVGGRGRGRRSREIVTEVAAGCLCLLLLEAVKIMRPRSMLLLLLSVLLLL